MCLAQDVSIIDKGYFILTTFEEYAVIGCSYEEMTLALLVSFFHFFNVT